MGSEEAERIALAGGEPARRQWLALVREVAGLRDEVARLRGLADRLEDLERQVNRDSSNSSMPPSSDAPKSRAERKRVAREAYKRSMRKPGGQPGHERKTREMVAPERLSATFEHLPGCCGCGWTFDGSERRVGDAVIHQQWELPPVVEPLIVEHHRVWLRCPGCEAKVLGEMPLAALSGYGPRLEAHIAMFAGVYRLSRRQIVDVVTNVFGVPISLGAVDKVIMRMSRVLADPWEELKEAIHNAEAVHMDETSWRLGGATQWLWVAASALVACFKIDPTRSQAAAKALIGADFGGFVISDRYAGYHFLDVLQQQLCWCHVIRQFVEVSQRSGPPGRRGVQLVKLSKKVLAVHRAFLSEDHDAAWLESQLAPLRARIKGLLEQCARGRHIRTANFAAGLLSEYDALWTFCDVAENLQIDATNNAAERAVRHAVLTRRVQGGTQSNNGSRWVERIQSVRETCRLQGRPVLAWLIQAAAAAHEGRAAPSLLPATAQSP